MFSGNFSPNNHPSWKPEHKNKNTSKNNSRFVGVFWSPNFVFTMSVSAVIFFRLLSDNVKFHCCLALILIRPYFKYTEVTTLSEHFSISNIRRFFYWFLFLSMFASIILLCFIYANLMLNCRYCCIALCSSRVLNI